MILYFTLALFYFISIYLIPWELIPNYGPFHFSYLFDILFSLVLIGFYKIHIPIEMRVDKKFYIRLIFIGLFSLIAVQVVVHLPGENPFLLLDHAFIKLVIVAPILEEFIFRVVLGPRFLQRLSLRKAGLINGAIFSFSHSFALLNLPSEYHPVIWWQLVYTFILGYCCYLSYERDKSIWAPVSLHFIFNLVFYLFL